MRKKKIIFQIYRNKYKLEKRFNHQEKKNSNFGHFSSVFRTFSLFQENTVKSSEMLKKAKNADFGDF